MKKTKRIVMAVILATVVAIAAFAIPACSCSGSKIADADISAMYVSDVKITYSNMRPSNNYYTLTMSYQALTTYGDGTYCLSVSETTHTGIVLSADDLTEEDIKEGKVFEGAKSNPRKTNIRHYYGDFTDEGSGAIKLGMPFRIVAVNAGNEGGAECYVDTAAWTDNMKKSLGQKNPQTQEPMIPYEEQNLEGYWVRNAFKETTVNVDTTTKRLTSIATVSGGQYGGVTPVIDKSEIPAAITLKNNAGPAYATIKGAYIGAVPALVYSGDSKNYNTKYFFESVITYDDGSYSFTESAVDISNLVLAKEGSGMERSKQSATLTSYIGEYKSTPNEFDSDTLDLTLKKAGRIVVASGSNTVSGGTLGGAESKYIDTSNWTDSMGASASDYLKTNAFEEKTFQVTLSVSGFLNK